MSTIGQFLHWLFSPEVLLTVLGVGLAVLTITLLVIMRTRWGQAKPLSKCVFLSVFAHMLLVGYASVTKVFDDSPPGKRGDVTPIHIISDDRDTEQPEETPEEQPWDQFATSESAREPQGDTPDVPAPDRESIEGEWDPQREPSENVPKFAAQAPTEVALPHEMQIAGDAPQITKSLHQESTGAREAEIEVPRTERRADATPTGPVTESIAGPARPSDTPTPLRSTDNNLPRELIATTPDVQRLADVSAARETADARPAIDDVVGATDASTLPQFGTARETAAAPGQAIASDVMASAVATNAGANGAAVESIGEGMQSGAAAEGASRTASPRRLANGRPLPGIYEHRVDVDRSQIARAEGGNARTEAAVAAALKWLSENQEDDGRWDADKHGAGQESRVFGHDRQGAGARADTGITALAVLAMMGAGNTHYEGQYRVNVQKGLEFLLRSQGRDGSMAGGSETFAQMYCHGMATLAIAEAYAMTGDERLKWWVEKAIGYSVSAQNSTDGGWRYRPGDAGDMSQFGWQVMALKTAETSGITVPDRTKQGMLRFLSALSSGRQGGLASYRPREDVSPTMTAEALACRYFLSAAGDSPVVDEAANYIAAHRPQREKMNLYYWYYGTLAMHQVQGERWSQWNEALQTRLLPAQRQDGRFAGTWDPGHDLWGGYGGRVYTTAMGALCLESYYRFSLTAGETTRRR
jgi:hypothetical protein